MEILKEAFHWISENYANFLVCLSVIVTALESIARLFPTKNYHSGIERVGVILRKIMDFLKVPNVKREEGKIISGTHKKETK